ncbi:MATE family efflux transporter [Aliiroseovarius crassostreae]|uniref:MATE family efflux transporter n=2 Tax=Aliiroseovarius crassostreae TaxID=154981 RepID=UPI0021FD836D|nr:MATE family efflux transporter [Aliiroseovarius crassostreae]UWP89932.1 MATE family efflux transporter [Aliiroseovarius crassostreae]UWP93091.1 MATE family efflux transporter [Aliiroseovarius crassostreae]UWP99387.1 MATE family efflux transporter [Aliiroseovarius crassostreae]
MTTLPQTLPQHMRAALLLGLPLIGSQLAGFAIQIIDTVMLGWYGVEALAAVVLAGTLFFVLMIMGSGFAWAVMPMVASASEAGDDTRVRRVTRMGFWSSAIIATLVMPALWWSEPLLLAIGQEPELSAIAQDYLRIMGWSLYPALGLMVLRSYLSALERTKVVLYATLLATVLNAFLNYALIFGNFGFPEMGVRGAALASLIVQCANFAVLVTYAVRALPEHNLFQRIWRPDWDALREVVRMGVQIGLTSLAEAGLFSASTVVMGWIGTLELAAHGIALQIVSAFFMVHIGLSNAATVRAGRALGRRDEEGLRRGALAITLLSLLFGGVSVLVFIGLPYPMISAFLDPAEPLRDEILRVGTSLLVVAALFQFADAAQVMALGLLRGVHDTKVPMVIASISYWLVGVPMSYLMGIQWGWGGEGVWAGLVIGLLCAGAFMSWRFWSRSSRLSQS